MRLDQPHVDYLTGHHQGRLATVAADGTPQNKPVGYHYNAALGTIDVGGFNMETSAKYRNITLNPAVSFVVDDAIGEGATGMRLVEVRGRAEPAQAESAASGSGVSSHIIRIRPRRVVSWNIGPGAPRMQAFDVAEPEPAGTQPARPTLGLGEGAARTARAAVERLVAELQAGLDSRDAELYNQHFAEDVIWGSPYGAVVAGYGELHAIHTRFHSQPEQPGGSSSRYEVVQVTAPAPGVALAHVRRVALDPEGRPVEPTADPTGAFSEMALYVLVRRGGTWWLAAGQNTLVRPNSTRS